MTLVGYGFNNMSLFGKSGDDHKRLGTNTVESLDGGMINISGEAQDQSGGATGEHVSAGDGDSGGPMFRDAATGDGEGSSPELIGVASAGGTSGIFGGGVASYIDLSSAASQAFLHSVGY